jgi:hypothetical protein
MCQMTAERFAEERAKLPSWGPEIDRDVQTYIAGLATCVTGDIQWSFTGTTRYFGDMGPEIQRHRTVELLPVKQK